jgi:hypothetical protein
MIALLSLDPGVTMGVCHGELEDAKLKLLVDQDKLSLSDIHDMLDIFMLKHRRSNHLIYESFEYRQVARKGLDLTPVKIIGVIELFREWHEPEVRFYAQSASQGKNFYTDAKLKELGVYKKGCEHGRDATRHLLHWLNFGAGGQFVDIDKITMELV